MGTRGTRALTAVAATFGVSMIAAVGTASSAQDEDNWLDDTWVSSTSYTTLVGGDYWYEAEIWQVAPAKLFGIPDEVNQMVGAQPVEVVFHWGDGSPDSVIRSDVDNDYAPVAIGCWSDYTVDESTVPPTFYPQDDFGLGCRVGAGHIYTKQGIFPLYLTGSQPWGNGSVATAQSGVFPQLVVDLAKGGTVTGKGTVYAPAGGGGMYDTDFAGGVASFNLAAKRRAGQAATSVTLTISVPSMNPDYPGTTTGLSFRAAAALSPMYIAQTKTGGEVFLAKVEGPVTNSGGPAGTARATIHAIVTKGKPTVIRIQLQNASAGFTYLDTGYQSVDYYSLDSGHDLLLTGSVKLG